MTWLDGPFFAIIDQINSTFSTFKNWGVALGQVVMFFSIMMLAIKAVLGGRLEGEFMKKVIMYSAFMILMFQFSNILKWIQDLSYRLPYNALYNEHIADKINNLQNDSERAKEFAEWSDIMREIDREVGTQSTKYYFVDIFDSKHHFIRPGAVGRMVMLIAERYWIAAKNCGIHIGQGFVMGLLFFTVIGCCLLTICVYQLAVLEFLIVTTIGCPLLAFMLFDGTKFIAEKVLGAVINMTIKLIFLTFVMMLVVSGYLDMVMSMSPTKDIAIDEVFKAVGLSVFYLTLILAAPKMANALATGTPQLVFSDLAPATAAAAAGAQALVMTVLAAVGAAKLMSSHKQEVLVAEAPGSRSSGQRFVAQKSDSTVNNDLKIGGQKKDYSVNLSNNGTNQQITEKKELAQSDRDSIQNKGNKIVTTKETVPVFAHQRSQEKKSSSSWWKDYYGKEETTPRGRY
jgi:hypothetical protein